MQWELVQSFPHRVSFSDIKCINMGYMYKYIHIFTHTITSTHKVTKDEEPFLVTSHHSRISCISGMFTKSLRSFQHKLLCNTRQSKIVLWQQRDSPVAASPGSPQKATPSPENPQDLPILFLATASPALSTMERGSCSEITGLTA